MNYRHVCFFSFTLFEKHTVLPLGCKQYNTIGCIHTTMLECKELIVAFRSQSARTILWSEIPGMEMQALTNEGLLQQKRSSRFWPLVGSVCIC